LSLTDDEDDDMLLAAAAAAAGVTATVEAGAIDPDAIFCTMGADCEVCGA
jgi:hypothetical protein